MIFQRVESPTPQPRWIGAMERVRFGTTGQMAGPGLTTISVMITPQEQTLVAPVTLMPTIGIGLSPAVNDNPLDLSSQASDVRVDNLLRQDP